VDELDRKDVLRLMPIELDERNVSANWRCDELLSRRPCSSRCWVRPLQPRRLTLKTPARVAT